MQRNVFVPLTEPARRALHDLAFREYRRPRDQARLLLEEALRQHGALPEEPTDLTTAENHPAAAMATP